MRAKNTRTDAWVRKIVTCVTFGLSLLTLPQVFSQSSLNTQPPSFTLMGIGDSITEGGTSFSSYLFPLWEKLFTAGYLVDFIGPNKASTRIGPLSHAGYSGHTAEFLEKNIDSIYREFPAEIVLLHSGHNHFADENPVEGIVMALRSTVSKIKKINPDAMIFVAQVIESGKLPKYSYLPELNRRIADLVTELERSFKGVYLVDQSALFNWETDTIEDKVHPNALGAEKMAEVWFQNILPRLEKPAQSFTPELVEYKKTEKSSLKLHIFGPEEPNEKAPKPCIVFFFGGGWKLGTPLQFYREASHYAARGFVAISADYRIQSVDGTSPFESVADAKSVVRWIRQHAEEYGIDPDRIVVAGASAGGHLAAATGTLDGFDEPDENTGISSVPNLNILYYPVLDLGPRGYGGEDEKARMEEISPIYHTGPKTPPTLILLGTEDPFLSVEQAGSYQSKLRESGQKCELILYPGAGHPIFYYRKGLSPRYFEILRATDRFLVEFGYLSIKQFTSDGQI